MKIVNVGYNYKHPADFCINRPYGSGDYIFLLLKTEAFFVFNNKKYIAPPNSVVLFKKGTPQIYGALSKEYVNDWIHFDIDDDEMTEIQKLDIPFDTILSINSIYIFSEFIKSMFYEKYSQNLYKEDSMNLYFNLILKKLSEMLKSNIPEKEKPHYDNFCRLRNEIQLTPQDNWNIDKICKKMNLSRSYIQHLYKSLFGVSIMEDVLQRRIDYAKYLLSSTDFTIYSISIMCGYANDVHFMRLFKKTVGITPSEYRISFKISQKALEGSKFQNPFCL
ncbi:MAG: helix-turn-helix domain-containing protein [Ruminococcaceae bacterium]|nr:helix-turn-helix domain-containing protein [Oscillospiraceae bacterium]